MSETLVADGQVKTYRGGSIEELLPRIRADLGPGAVILRRREGLFGGVGGFFQKKCIEVDARAGVPGIDVYDEAPDYDDEEPKEEVPIAADDGGWRATDDPPPLRNDAATREGLASPAVRKLVAEAQPFADLLGDLGEPTPPVERTVKAATLVEGMIAAGLGADLAEEIVDAVVASSLPFANAARLRTLVKDQLAARIPVAPAPSPGPRSLALVGPAGAGKTAAAARICAAHAAAGQAVTCLAIAPSDGGGALRELLADVPVDLQVSETPAGAHKLGNLVVVDTPPAWGQAPSLGELAAALTALELDEVHAVMRAGTAAAAGEELLTGLAPLAPNRLLATGLGETSHLGSIADLAIRRELPLSYLADGADAIVPAEARGLAARITP